jgi:hypothetical protein
MKSTTGMSECKFVNASQGIIQKFLNLNRKLYMCNANIYFNKQCIRKQLTPAYARIKVPNTSPAHKNTQKKIPAIRIKDEIKFLYSKKQQINLQVYKLHLLLANTWGNAWAQVHGKIDDKIQKEARDRYRTIDRKLEALGKTQTAKLQEKRQFYPRVVNNTDINFSDQEMNMLQKGLKYNTHGKKKDWIQTLALEAETAISKLPVNERDPYRKIVAKRINVLQTKHPNHIVHPETRTINSIRKKLEDNNAMITKADKGNTMVILPVTDYETKIHNFTSNSNFYKEAKDPTKKYQAEIKRTVQRSQALIPEEQRWKYTNMNPTAPTIKGLIKLHKQDQPIRPVINWRNAPAYKLSRLFNDKMKHIAPLPYAFNLKNTLELQKELKETPIKPSYTLASLDISNMYSNIPIKETKTIIATVLNNYSTEQKTVKELMTWYDVITKQNYFTHNDETIFQRDGLAMGAPSSGLIAEFFLQHLEHKHLKWLTEKHKLINYHRYVDDILLIFDGEHTNIQLIVEDFNSLHPNMQFTAESGIENTLSYLDISLHKSPTNISTSIYRKPTTTDTIIPFNSNHPAQHKYAAIRYLYNRLNSYNLQAQGYQQELNTIHNIMQNNSFPIKQNKPWTHKKREKTPPAQKHSWAAFTYTGKETLYVTNIFKNTDVNVTFRTTSNLGHLLGPKNHNTDRFTKSGVYKLTCPDCHKAYVGQTGRQFLIRYKEHERSFRDKNDTSRYAKHLNESGHSFGPIKDIMETLEFQRKGIHLNTMEKFHIHKELIKNNHLNDPQTMAPNPIFDMLANNHGPQ